MTEVKVCGMRDLEDAVAACEFGADAVGFVFFRKSPRYVDPLRAKGIIERLPGNAAKIGVFVNQELSEVRHIFSFCGLDLIQLHGNETMEYCRMIPPGLWIKAVPLETHNDLVGLERLQPRAFLVDARDPVRYGGTGKVSNWELAAVLAARYPVILAGGLNPTNVKEAICAVSPAAVDVGSGVEKAPGKKDHEKMRAFIQEARAAKGGSAIGGIFSREKQ